MKARFLAAAFDELEDAHLYYERRQMGLGDEFAEEIEETIGRITSHPFGWSGLSDGERLCRTHRFPYGVVYRVDEGEVVIVAVTHLHREPDYWKHRD